MKKTNLSFGMVVLTASVLLSGILLAGSTASGSGTGGAAEGAYVSLEWTGGNHYYSNETITDSNGYYEMNVAGGDINLTALFGKTIGNESIAIANFTGFFTVSGTAWKNITLRNFPDDNATIKGKLYDNETKTPISGSVTVLFSDGYFLGMNHTNADISEGYEINLPASNVTITASADGYYSNGTMVLIGDGETKIADIYLVPIPPSPPVTAMVKGYIKNASSDNPIENADVSIAGMQISYLNSTSTNASGYYEFAVPEGNFSLVTSADGYFDNLTVCKVNDTETKWRNISLIPYLRDNAWVSGYVYDNKSNPIAGANVSVEGRITIYVFTVGFFTRNGTTDATGYYNISTPAVEYIRSSYYPYIPINSTRIDEVSASADGYFDNSTYGGTIEPGNTFNANLYLDSMPEENYMAKGYIYMEGLPQPNQPPNVTITSPTNGTTASGTVNIQGVSSDADDTVQLVQIKIDDGSWVAATGTTSWSDSWDTTAVANGSHIIYARSYDGTDYSGIDYMTVNVNNIPSNPKILYVGGIGSGNYSGIQDAINAATNGDIIKVYPGTYDGSIVINKEIKLVGDPVINGHGGYGVKIERNNTVVENFTVANASTGIYVHNYSFTLHNTTIENCTVYFCTECGIEFEKVCKGIVNGSTIYNCSKHGIKLRYADNITISNNTIFRNGLDGMFLDNSSDNNTITTNNIYNNSADGIELYHSSNNSIISNKVYSNSYEGLQLYTCSNNHIISNNIYNNSRYGIYLLKSSDNNSITECNIYGNADKGIYIDYSQKNAISHCNIHNNHDGIRLSSSSFNNISFCNIFGHSFNGIFMDWAGDNVIHTCNISGNERGIHLYFSYNNLIYNNYFNNTDFGNPNNAYDNSNNIWNISKISGKNIVGGDYIGGNYWSDYAGIDTDGDKLGDTLLPYNASGSIENKGDFLPLLIPENNPPETPHSPSPANGAIDVGITTTLSWYCLDPDGDSLSYDIYFGSSSNPPKVKSNQTSTAYNPGALQHSTTYSWRIVVWDSNGAKTIGPIWHFTTTAPPKQYTLTTSVDPSGSGSITLNPSGGTYDEGTTVTVTAYDNSGYQFNYWSGDVSRTSSSIQITMDSNKSITAHFSAIPSPPANQPPNVTITSPTNGTTVSGTVNIQGVSSDADDTVQLVQIKIDDGSWVAATGTTSWSDSWDTTAVANGSHIIYARSYDGTDYSGIDYMTVNVNNIPSNNKPAVEIIFPDNGTEVKKSFTVHGTASDTDGNETIQKVEIKIGNEDWEVVNGTTSWNYTWDSTTVDNGDYVIQARAYDGQEYSDIDSIVVNVSNQKGDGTPGFEMLALLTAMVTAIGLRKKR